MRPGEDGLCGSSCVLSVCRSYIERDIFAMSYPVLPASGRCRGVPGAVNS